MNFDFINEYEITLDVYKTWVTRPLNKKAKQNKQRRLILFVAGMIFSAALIVFGIFWPNNVAIFIGGILMLILFFRAVMMPDIAIKKQYFKIKDPHGDEPWIRSYAFSDVITVTDFQTRSDYKYHDILSATEDNDYFYLWFNKDAVIRVMKNAFKKGSEQDFRGFIVSKIKKSKNDKKRR